MTVPETVYARSQCDIRCWFLFVRSKEVLSTAKK